jgi:hypothetical protein
MPRGPGLKPEEAEDAQTSVVDGTPSAKKPSRKLLVGVAAAVAGSVCLLITINTVRRESLRTDIQRAVRTSIERPDSELARLWMGNVEGFEGFKFKRVSAIHDVEILTLGASNTQGTAGMFLPARIRVRGECEYISLTLPVVQADGTLVKPGTSASVGAAELPIVYSFEVETEVYIYPQAERDWTVKPSGKVEVALRPGYVRIR